MAYITVDQILESLKKVNDPDLHRDLVSLNMIANVKVEGSKVSFDVNLTTPACPLKDLIKNDCIKTIKADHPSVTEINVNMGATVTGSASVKSANILKNVKNTIAVASGKGGVGKSTVAVNLAVALAKEGAKVGLIDADIYGPSIPLMLGISERPQAYMQGDKTVLLPVENYGVQLMSIGFLVEEDAPIIWRGPMASGAVKQFLTDVEWDDLDYLLFDMPPGTGDIQLTLCQTIPLTGAVIVSTPQNVALADARKALKMFERVNVPILGIVENMSYFVAPDTGAKYDIFGTGGGEKLAAEGKTTLLGKIPIDPRIRVGGDTGTPILYGIPDSENALAITNIAKQLAAQVSINNIGTPATRRVEIVMDEEED